MGVEISKGPPPLPPGLGHPIEEHDSSTTRKHKHGNTDDFWGVKSFLADGPNLWKQLLAELLGTMIFVFIATGATLNWGPKSRPSPLSIAFAVGCSRTTLIQVFGHISGCLINPSVTFSFMVAGYFKPLKGLAYIIFQCIGGILGSLLLAMVIPREVHGRLGVTMPDERLHPLQSITIETILTTFQCLVVFSIFDEVINARTGAGKIGIGFLLICCNLLARPATGASMNPARSLGPAVATNVWKQFYVYIVGPMLGGLIAAKIYASLFYMGKPPKKDDEDDDNDSESSASTISNDSTHSPRPLLTLPLSNANLSGSAKTVKQA